MNFFSIALCFWLGIASAIPQAENEAAWGNLVHEWEANRADAAQAASKSTDSEDQEILGHMIRNITIPRTGAVALGDVGFPGFEAGLKLYRLVPHEFPSDMPFHFDGLAAVLVFEFNATHLQWRWEPFESRAQKNFSDCVFLGTGTGPTRPGDEICFQNPGVNLLPIAGQLWLTIDTVAWGRVDPESLATIPDSVVAIDSMVLARPKSHFHCHHHRSTATGIDINTTDTTADTTTHH